MATSCHASRLDRADNDSRFNADDRNVDNHNNGLLEIVLLIAEIFLIWINQEIFGLNFAVMKISDLLSKKQESIKPQRIMLLNLKKILKIIYYN